MSAAHSHSDRTVLGIVLGLAAFGTLSVSDAMTKLLSSGYSVFEVASVDAVIAALISLPVLVKQQGWAALRPKNPGIVALRSLVGSASLMTAFVAFSLIPLADAYALSFIAPLIVTALSVPVLGEHVGWKQWTAVIVGFAAVIVILRPDFHGLGAGQIYMLASAALFSGSMILVRRISKSESSASLTLVYFIMLFLISLPVTILHWKTPDLHAAAILIITGAASGLGNVLLIMAFRYAKATIVSSFMYSQLLWGTLFGLALFDDLPDLITVLGAAVIIACGIYTLTQATTAARRVPV